MAGNSIEERRRFAAKHFKIFFTTTIQLFFNYFNQTEEIEAFKVSEEKWQTH